MMTIRQFYLLKLMEECDEVSQRASKQMQFGRDQKQSQDGLTASAEMTAAASLANCDRLKDEIKDFLAVFQLLVMMEEIPLISYMERQTHFDQKRAKLAKFLKLSQSEGAVEAGDAW